VAVPKITTSCESYNLLATSWCRSTPGKQMTTMASTPRAMSSRCTSLVCSVASAMR
jgi:hypothetical protein